MTFDVVEFVFVSLVFFSSVTNPVFSNTRRYLGTKVFMCRSVLHLSMLNSNLLRVLLVSFLLSEFVIGWLQLFRSFCICSMHRLLMRSSVEAMLNFMHWFSLMFMALRACFCIDCISFLACSLVEQRVVACDAI